MVTRAVTFVIMAVTSKVQKIEFVDQAETLQKLKRPVDSNLRDLGIDFLGACKNFVRVHMLGGGLHYFHDHPALTREADFARPEFLLKMARWGVDVDSLAR